MCCACADLSLAASVRVSSAVPAARLRAVAIIGDEDTVTGFLLAGIGHRDQKNAANFLVVDAES
jgi:hypothetical protein